MNASCRIKTSRPHLIPWLPESEVKVRIREARPRVWPEADKYKELHSDQVSKDVVSSSSAWQMITIPKAKCWNALFRKHKTQNMKAESAKKHKITFKVESKTSQRMGTNEGIGQKKVRCVFHLVKTNFAYLLTNFYFLSAEKKTLQTSLQSTAFNKTLKPNLSEWRPPRVKKLRETLLKCSKLWK